MITAREDGDGPVTRACHRNHLIYHKKCTSSNASPHANARFSGGAAGLARPEHINITRTFFPSLPFILLFLALLICALLSVARRSNRRGSSVLRPAAATQKGVRGLRTGRNLGASTVGWGRVGRGSAHALAPAAGSRGECGSPLEEVSGCGATVRWDGE
jgi:hypothetical protein